KLFLENKDRRISRCTEGPIHNSEELANTNRHESYQKTSILSNILISSQKNNSDDHFEINTKPTDDIPLCSNASDIYEFKSDSIENDDKNDPDFKINDSQSVISSDTEIESSNNSRLETEIICELSAPLVFEKKKEKKNMHCKFCSQDIATKNFMRHVTRTHASEREVKNILQYPKNSKERRRAFGLLRNDTNFDLYLKGTVRPNRQRFKVPKEDTEYVPCAYCKGLFDRHYLKRHIKSCTVFNASEIHMKGKRKDLLSLSHTLTACVADPTNVISQLKVKEQVFDLMKGDQISFEAKKDLLIANFGNSYLKKHKRERMAYACSTRMRELSRLLISFRTIVNNENVHFKDLLHPKHFDAVISAVRNIAGYNPFTKTFNSPSLAMHLGTSLKLICDELRHLIIKESQGFKCQSAIECSLANKDLQEKRWKKPLLLPLVSDIKKFRDETLKIANNCKQLFLNNEGDQNTYKDLVQCVLALLIVFNRRRIGDVQFLKIKEYQLEKKNYATDFESVLTETEKSSTIQWGKGDVAIRYLAKKIQLDNAHAFSSNKLRKQIATVMQILNLTKGEIKQFSDFLGHTLKTHEEFYELPVDMYQTAKVSKMLLMMEKGSTPGEYKGKSLAEINFDPNFEYAEENDDDFSKLLANF
ncbi:hypothetical protein NQ314_006764, partial [Rhamnusium bicolor]